MTRLILAFSIFLSGCASNYHKLGANLKDVRPKLSEGNSFAFLFKGDQYFFAPEYFKQDGRECHIYLGFKNEQLAYAFANNLFNDIEKDYAANNNPDTIKKLILKRVENQKPTERRCHELGQGPPPDAGQGVGIAILLFPITIPYGTYAYVKDSIDKGPVKKMAKEVQLGLPREKMPAWVVDHWNKKTKGSFVYYEYVKGPLKTIFYFEDDKLNAWSSRFHGEFGY